MNKESNPLLRMLALAAVLGAGLGGWYLWRQPAPKPALVTPPPEVTTPIEAPAPSAPSFPVEAIAPAPASAPSAPLPDLFDSDAHVLDALAALLVQPNVSQWLVSEHLIQRFVAFIDALPNRKISMNLWPAKPASGRFFVQATDTNSIIAAPNSARYDAHVAALTGLDTQATVALYVRLYPLLQQAYRDLGFPDRHFNDRFIAVLDHLLEAPEPQGAIAVVQNEKGQWIYRDETLESASTGQKFLIRLGQQHESAVKEKLREFRAALAGQRP